MPENINIFLVNCKGGLRKERYEYFTKCWLPGTILSDLLTVKKTCECLALPVQGLKYAHIWGWKQVWPDAIPSGVKTYILRQRQPTRHRLKAEILRPTGQGNTELTMRQQRNTYVNKQYLHSWTNLQILQYKCTTCRNNKVWWKQIRNNVNCSRAISANKNQDWGKKLRASQRRVSIYNPRQRGFKIKARPRNGQKKSASRHVSSWVSCLTNTWVHQGWVYHLNNCTLTACC